MFLPGCENITVRSKPSILSNVILEHICAVYMIPSVYTYYTARISSPSFAVFSINKLLQTIQHIARLEIQYNSSKKIASGKKVLVNLFSRYQSLNYFYILYQFTGFENTKEVELNTRTVLFEYVQDSYNTPQYDLILKYSSHIEGFVPLPPRVCFPGRGLVIKGYCYISHFTQGISWNGARTWCRYQA